MDQTTTDCLTIDADQHGLGDAVVTAWIAEGAKDGPVKVFHRASGKTRRLLEALGQVVVEEPRGKLVTTFATYYGDELKKERGTVPRPWSRARGLGISTEPKRPTVSLPADAEQWAEQNAPDGPFVLLFPESCYRCREWPRSHWIELSWRLQAAGIVPIVMLASDREEYQATPRRFWGTDIAAVMALMRRAAVTVANDSGPAHIAGTLDVPAIVMTGPTNPTVFSHYDSVRLLRPWESVCPCVGCHWGAPYRAACDAGCFALAATTVGQAYNRIVSTIRPDLQIDPGSGLFIRRGAMGNQDMDVVREVIFGDCYGLRTMERFDREAFVVDVGGHIGSFVRHCEALQPRAKIVSVEAVTENARQLALNCGQCTALRATAVHGAVSYRDKPLAIMSSLVPGGVATGGSVVIERDDADPETWTPIYGLDDRPLAAMTLERIIEDHRASRIDLLKLDCEGSEHDILANSPAVHSGGVLRVVGEYHGEERFRDLIQKRFSDGWDVTIHRPGGGSIGYFSMRRHQ